MTTADDGHVIYRLDPSAVRDVHQMEGINPVAAHYAFRDGLRRYQPLMTVSPVKNPIPVVNMKRTKQLFEPRPSRTLAGSGGSMAASASRSQPSYIAAIHAASAANHKAILQRYHAVDHDAEVMREDFRRKLMRRYRNVLGGWRVLDARRCGRVAFADLCRAAPDLGFICDARVLWECLDQKQDGFITLDELDADLARLLAGFAAVLAKSCGTAVAAWMRHFSPGNENGRCNAELFQSAANAAGYVGDCAEVYEVLNVDGTPSGVCYEEFALLDQWFKPTPPGNWSHANLRARNAGSSRSSSAPQLHAIDIASRSDSQSLDSDFADLRFRGWNPV